MLFTVVTLGLLIAAFAFLIRVPFVLSQGTDEWLTLWVTDQQRERGPTYEISDSVRPARFGYPPLQYFLLSRFPKRLWKLVGNALNIGYDALAAVLVFGVSYVIFAGTGSLERLYAASLTAVLFATTPALTPVTARLNGVKARSLGGLLVLVYFLLFGGAFLYGQTALYLLAVPVGVMVVLSSAFALQILAFVSFGLAVMYWDIIPLAVLTASIFVGLVAPRLGVRDVLLWKYYHFRWYFRSYEGTAAERRNDFRLLWKLLRERRWAEATRRLAVDISPSVALYSVPGIVVLVYILIALPGGLNAVVTVSTTRYAGAIVLLSGATFALTSLPPFLFLGQAERYFEYAAPFLAFLLVDLFLAFDLSFGLLVGLVALQLIIVLGLFVYNVQTLFRQAASMELPESEQDVLSFLREHGGERRILTIPAKLSFRIAGRAEGLNAKFYHMFAVHDRNGFDYMDEDLVAYNLPRPDFGYFARKYGINTVVALKDRLGGLDYHQAGGARIYENERYIIWRVEQDSDPVELHLPERQRAYRAQQ